MDAKHNVCLKDLILDDLIFFYVFCSFSHSVHLGLLFFFFYLLIRVAGATTAMAWRNYTVGERRDPPSIIACYYVKIIIIPGCIRECQRVAEIRSNDFVIRATRSSCGCEYGSPETFWIIWTLRISRALWPI